MCKYLRFHQLGRRKDFDAAKNVLNLQSVPESNGYFQNFKERHKNCKKEKCSLIEKKDSSLFPMIFENIEQNQEFSRDTMNSSYISLNLENTEESQIEYQPPVDLSYLQEYLQSDVLGDSFSLQVEMNSFWSTSEFNNLLNNNEEHYQ